MKLILDCYGGDFSPKANVLGAVSAVKEFEDLSLVLTGRKNVIEDILTPIYDGDRIEVVNADEVINNSDIPTIAIKQKTESSMVKALELLKNDDSISGLVSAGSTGALLAGSVMKLGRLKNISRPALCPIIPTVKSQGVALIDCGANVDCKPDTLLHFAVMGSAYMSTVFGIEKPKIGLLCNGTEDKKGNLQTKEAYALLADSKLNFMGNMEGRDILSGDYDVVVSDGFAGNIALKTLEGTAGSIFSLLKKGIAGGGLKAKLGALLLKDVFRNLKKKLDYNEIGGAGFLGVNKVVVKAHGSSSDRAIATAISQARKMSINDVIGKIQSILSMEGK